MASGYQLSGLEVWASTRGTRCSDIQRFIPNIPSQSDWTGITRQRDATCRITAFESGTEVAHLIPEHDRERFPRNFMFEWNINQTLDQDNLLRDPINAVLLRADIHAAFDQRRFVFFPKDSEGFVVHMLESTSDIRPLYHNTRVNIRFAWSIFPYLASFLSRPASSRLVVRLDASGKRVVEEVTNLLLLARKATASGSNNRTKRSRMATDLDEDVGYPSKRLRINEARICQSSFDTTLPSSEDEGGFDPQLSCTLDNSRSITHSKVLRTIDPYSDTPHQGDVHIEKLRQEALARQRPVGYTLPPYDRHRPAIEELELVGIEII